MSKAAAQGDKNGIKLRDALEAIISKQQISEAHSLAYEWEERYQ